MASRPERPLLIVDIAVPRDVEGAAREVANVHLFDIDDLESAAEANLEARRREVGAVERIVENEAGRFGSGCRSRRRLRPLRLCASAPKRRGKAELERTLARLGHLSDADRKRIEAMSDALVKRLLHEPVTRLRQHGSERHVEALRELFGLDED